MKKIRKAIIPAAGLGTRFLPATKAIPKEMLPILDKPAIQYIVEEAIISGIKDIIIVTSHTKRAIEDHFDANFELEETLRQSGKLELLEKVKVAEIDIHYIRQKEPKGLGHAIWCARNFIDNEPFAVLLPDDIVLSDTPALKQLMEQYNEKGKSVIGVQSVEQNQTHRYGIVKSEIKEGQLYEVKGLVEKPTPNLAPSNMAIMARYVLTPEIFKYLDKKQIGSGGEIHITDAIQMLSKEQKVYAYAFEGERYDVGEISGFIKTTIKFALENSKTKDEIKSYIKEMMEDEKIIL